MQKTERQDAEGLCVNNASPCKYGECLSPGKKMMGLRNKEISYAKVRESLVYLEEGLPSPG